MTDEIDPQVRLGSIVQIDPELCPEYAGEFIIVTEILNFGVMGYLAMVHPREVVRSKDIAYLRMSWKKIKYIGQVNWRIFRDWTDQPDSQNDNQNDDQSDRSE